MASQGSRHRGRTGRDDKEGYLKNKMPAKRAKSRSYLPLAVLLPLLLLVALAVQGMRARTKAAWDEMGEEAKFAGAVMAEELGKQLPHSIREVSQVADPPPPGNASPLDEVLDGSDPAALWQIVRDTNAGNTPAGLPRRVVAALRLMEVDPAYAESPNEDLGKLGDLANECPSILSPVLLEKLGPLAYRALKGWLTAQEAFRLLAERPESGWRIKSAGDPGEPEIWWVEGDSQRARFITDAGFLLADIANGRADLLPASCRPRLALRDETPRSAAAPDLLASVPVAFGEGLRVEIYAKDPAAMARDFRNREAWTLGFVALASLVSIGGLWVMLATLKRERKLNEMKSQFVASVSHELRAPVASIRLMADALEEGKLAPETAKQFHRLIAREGARLSTLVGNVLDHSRIEQGRRVWKMELTDVGALVADTLRVMQPLAAEKGILLTSRLDAVEATVDAGAIQQALVNLLDNAIKFSPAGSAVDVALTKSDERRTCEIRVEDQGPGIPKAEQDRIFELFYRPGDELRRETQGTGIGLSLVKSISEAHGGAVLVESELGKGSVFVLRFPLAI